MGRCVRGLEVRRLDDQVLAALRGQVTSIGFGTAFVGGGIAAALLAAVRRQPGTFSLWWLGAWSAMYGARLLGETPAVVAALPRRADTALPYLNTALSYLLVVAGSLAWLGLSRGGVRRLLQAAVIVGLVIAAGGIGAFLWNVPQDAFRLLNSLLAVGALVVLLAVLTVRGLADRYLLLSNRAVLMVGSILFALEALYANLARPLHLDYSPVLGHVGFAILLVSFAVAAVQTVLDSERRLLAIDSELSVARRLQFSILPTAVPATRGVRMAATYQPMTAVAGDFYDFIPVDEHRVGVLIADVSGHGVPAALIASMLKIARQSVVACAHEPRSVLRGLNHALAGELRDQFVSAAYLWIDTENRRASYSAAGHPPLLLWRQGTLQRIESNGLVFGFQRDADYPVHSLPLSPGDRFLLYTDGVLEAESAAGEFFGDRRLDEVVQANQSSPPAELLDRLLAEIRMWRPASVPPQDDITIIIADVDVPA
jgi:sigma-B regulation protein RsbU (phosphoserine phosphatase)